MLAHAGEKHAEDAPGNQAKHQRGKNAAKALWQNGFVGEVGFGDGLQIQLLALGFVPRDFQGSEGGGELLVREFPVEGEALVFGGFAG